MSLDSSTLPKSLILLGFDAIDEKKIADLQRRDDRVTDFDAHDAFNLPTTLPIPANQLFEMCSVLLWWQAMSTTA